VRLFSDSLDEHARYLVQLRATRARYRAQWIASAILVVLLILGTLGMIAQGSVMPHWSAIAVIVILSGWTLKRREAFRDVDRFLTENAR
jgi:protein-S-isoprenylcysteine O-methyltransferase Ste14